MSQDTTPGPAPTQRYFVTYSGVRLPLKLVTPLAPDQLGNRNTCFRATYDGLERLVLCEKLVYGSVELTHRYRYHGDGATLAEAEITGPDGEVRLIRFDAEGAPLPPPA